MSNLGLRIICIGTTGHDAESFAARTEKNELAIGTPARIAGEFADADAAHFKLFR